MPFPHLDDRCGQYLSYREFVECGETWEETRIDNVPKQQATYDAMRGLAEAVLDPIAKSFGRPTLSYAFASAALSRLIQKKPYPNVTPRTDQHAGCEVNTKGRLICSRKGMAVDLRVDGVSSSVVAAWAALNTPFDRIYVYGEKRPFHVSYGPDNTGMLLRMVGEKGASHLPGRKIYRGEFSSLSVEELMADPIFV